MKKKILAIAMAIALVVVVAMPMGAFAATTTDVTGSVTTGYTFSASDRNRLREYVSKRHSIYL